MDSLPIGAGCVSRKRTPCPGSVTQLAASSISSRYHRYTSGEEAICGEGQGDIGITLPEKAKLPFQGWIQIIRHFCALSLRRSVSSVMNNLFVISLSQSTVGSADRKKNELSEDFHTLILRSTGSKIVELARPGFNQGWSILTIQKRQFSKSNVSTNF